MKELLIMRHGKSYWGNPALDDFERPLKKRGIRAAGFMGKKVGELSLSPDVILSSPAVRARETTNLFMDHCNCHPEVQWLEDIYYQDELRVLSHIQKLPDSYQRAMVVGHNPTLENLGNLFISKGIVNLKLPTAALLYITFDINHWKDVNPGSGILEWLLPPKILQEK